MKLHIVIAATAAALLLTGCGSAPTRSTPAGSPATDAALADVTDEVRAALPGNLADLVTSASREETGLIEVATTIVDPRGEDGSPEAQQAVAICEAVYAALSPRVLRVNEADGTAFAINEDLGKSAGVCVEY